MKKVGIIWSEQALNDLELIYDFLAEQSIAAAQSTIEKILARIRQIETFPESGAIQQGLQKSNKTYRYLVEGNYKIIYSIADNIVYITTVFDTRFNPEKLDVS